MAVNSRLIAIGISDMPESLAVVYPIRVRPERNGQATAFLFGRWRPGNNPNRWISDYMLMWIASLSPTTFSDSSKKPIILDGDVANIPRNTSIRAFTWGG